VEPGDPVVVVDADGDPVDADTVVEAYRARLFPMADSRDAPLRWYRPRVRAVVRLDAFRMPRSLAKTWRKAPYRLTIDTACAQVIQACAEARPTTWISHDVERLYLDLHRRGRVHSVEAWRGDDLVGGLYGLDLGRIFCGESLFHRADDAAKLCVVHLAGWLRGRGFVLLDCQQMSAHVARFGAEEVDDRAYARMVAQHGG